MRIVSYSIHMDMPSGPARIQLTTIGRRSGDTHTVTLRGVPYRGSYYFSRHRPDSDWFLNALVWPVVTVTYNQQHTQGLAFRVRDIDLERRISHLKYPGQKRAEDRRVTLRVIPLCECE